MKKLIHYFILSIICYTGCQQVSAHYLVFAYEDFGPQAMAWQTIGMQWWQWENHGSNKPNDQYHIKVVVYQHMSLAEIQSIFPVNHTMKQDFRYLQSQTALQYLDKNINEMNQIDESWAQTLKTRLTHTKKQILNAH